MTEKEYNPKTDPEVIEFKKVIRAVLMTALIMILISTIWTIFASFGYGNFKTSASNDVEYIFENDILYSNSSVDYSSQFNMRERVLDTGDYNATYSFTDDIIGGNATGWIDRVGFEDPDEYGIHIITETVNNHNMVLNISSPIGEYGGVMLNMTENPSAIGYIEYWWLTDNVNNLGYISFLNATYDEVGYEEAFEVYINSGNMYAMVGNGAGGVAYTNIGVVSNNVWNHISIYYSTITDTLSIWRNEILVIDDITFMYDLDFDNDLSYLELAVYDTTDSSYYFDAIGLVGSFFTGEYNATYTFTNSSELDDWDLNEVDPLVNIDVIAEKDEHSNVVFINDTSDTGIGTMQINNFDDVGAGTIEYWIYNSDTIKSSYNHFLFDTTIGIYLYTNLGNLLYHDGSSHIITALSSNEWHHIRVDFETGVALYLGLAQDTFAIWIDFVEYGPYNFQNGLDNINKFHFGTSIGSQNPELYLDAYGGDHEDWWPYQIGDNYESLFNLTDLYVSGDNLLPVINYTGIIEVDKTEFAFEALNDFNDVGEDNPSGWVDVEDGYDNVNIQLDSGDANDRVVEFDGDGNTPDTIGLNKDFTIVNGTLNISWSLYIEQRDTSEGSFNVSIYSEDLTLLVDIGMRYYNPITGSELTYYNGSQYIELIDVASSSIGDDDKLEFYLIIEDEFDTCGLTFYENDILEDSWNFLKINTAKDGLGKIEFTMDTPSNEPTYAYVMYLDWIGVYADDVSINDDYGYSTVKMYVNGWIYDYWNLVYIDADAYMEVGVCSAADTDPYDPEQNSEVIKTLYQYNNIEVFENLADNPYVIPWGADTIFYPILLFFIKGGEFEINSIRIEGVRLVDDSHGNSYILEYNSGSVDLDESYFYVSESDNRLRFTMTTDDSNLEFIEASFVVQYQNTFNYSMLWGGLKTYTNMEAEFRIEYTDTTYFPYLLTTSSVYKNNIIAQGMIINGFSLIITDNDNDAMGIITGYIESIILIFTPSAGFDIIISDYLGILTPILLIAVITITIWQATKKTVKTMLIVPSMLFMSFSVFLMDMIPLWLFFVIIASGVVFVYTKWEDMFSIFTGFASMITGFLVYAGIVDFWVFYLSFFIMVGYIIFGIRKNVVG